MISEQNIREKDNDMSIKSNDESLQTYEHLILNQHHQYLQTQNSDNSSVFAPLHSIVVNK